MSEERFNLLRDLLVDYNEFRTSIQTMDEEEIKYYVELLKGLVGDFQTLYNVICRLYKLITGMLNISLSEDEEDSFRKNVELICDILNC